MNSDLQLVLARMPRAVCREALLSFRNGVRYLAYGVVWGAHGPGTALVL